jgi:hypothetical protein
MSEIEADLKFSAAAYLRDLALSAKTPERQTAALSQATTETQQALAEARISDGPKQPTLNNYQAPPMTDVKRPGFDGNLVPKKAMSLPNNQSEGLLGDNAVPCRMIFDEAIGNDLPAWNQTIHP